jgi:hypothetical protein
VLFDDIINLIDKQQEKKKVSAIDELSEKIDTEMLEKEMELGILDISVSNA